MARSYNQFCGLARALDVVGERWTLLVARELLGGPRTYSELLAGLPGMATNLLTTRLRSLEDKGVVAHRDDGRYELTHWGHGLRESIYALGRWAGPLMSQPRGDDHFQPSWLRHMVVARFDGHDPQRRDLTVELRCEDEVFALISSRGRVHLASGPCRAADISLAGAPDDMVGLLLGRITAAEATRRGVTTRGPLRRLRGLRPRGEYKVPGTSV